MQNSHWIWAKSGANFAQILQRFFLTLLMTSGANCIRTIQDTLRKCYLGPYFKTLTDILSLISIHIMSQTICSRIGEVNWLNSSSVYLIINMGDAWKTSSPTGKKRKKYCQRDIFFFCRSINYLYWSFWLTRGFRFAEVKMNGLPEKQTCAPLNHIFLNLFLILSVCHLVAGWTPLFNGTYFKIAL